MKKTDRLDMRVEPELLTALDGLIPRPDMSRSDLVREILRKWVQKKYKNKV